MQLQRYSELTSGLLSSGIQEAFDMAMNDLYILVDNKLTSSKALT